MAEYCRECAIKHLGFTVKEMKRAVMSADPDYCEGCQEWKPVLMKLRPTLYERIERKVIEKRGY